MAYGLNVSSCDPLRFAKMAYSPSINARLIEAYEKRDHVDPV